MADNQLSPKEQYERERALKRQERGHSPSTGPVAARSGSRIWPWVISLIIFAGAIFGLYKLATMPPPNSAAVSGQLADPVVATDWTAGSQSAKVQLVEYGDLQCPACGFYSTWVQKLRQEFGTKIGVTFRHFPLRQTHQNAQISSQVAEAAGLQGKFWSAVDTIYDNQKLWSEQIVARDTLINLLAPTGLNLEKLKSDIDSDIVKNKIEANYQSGLRSGVDSTPSFFLNGQRISNPQSYEEFQKLITDALGA